MAANLLARLAARAAAGRPLRVGLIGVSTFSLLFLAQARRLPGLHVLGVADPTPERARALLLRAGWPEAQCIAPDIEAALVTGTTYIGDDAAALTAARGVDLVVEATDSPAAGIAHCLLAIDYGRHVVMANIGADALVGPLLAKRAAEAGLVYSLAYGTVPALVVEQVTWARTCGLDVVCAGKGLPYLPAYHQITPKTVGEHYGLTPAEAASGDENLQLRTMGVDGTWSALELAAAVNACGLTPQPDGLRCPPCSLDTLPSVFCPEADGGTLSYGGTVEIASSLERDGTSVRHDPGRSIFVTFAIPDAYVARHLAEAGLPIDPSGHYGATYSPHQLGGFTLTHSVLRVGLCGEPMGAPTGFYGDAVAVAKRDLAADEILDGAGGYTVFGALRPATDSLARGYLPIGLAHEIALRHPVPAGQPLTWDDVLYEPTNPAVRMRRLMERTFGAARSQTGA